MSPTQTWLGAVGAQLAHLRVAGHFHAAHFGHEWRLLPPAEQLGIMASCAEYEAAQLAMIPSTIKAYRLQHNLTQAELGEWVGVQKAQISKREHNASNVTLDTLRKVFAAMQTVV